MPVVPIQLCTNLNLPATRYVTIKAVMLSGGLPPSVTSLSNGATVSGGGGGAIESAIKNFLTKAGWLQHTGTA